MIDYTRQKTLTMTKVFTPRVMLEDNGVYIPFEVVDIKNLQSFRLGTADLEDMVVTLTFKRRNQPMALTDAAGTLRRKTSTVQEKKAAAATLGKLGGMKRQANKELRGDK